MSKAMMGFTYKVKQFDKDGVLVSETEDHNLIPIEGLNYIIDAALRGASQFPTIYCGLFEGDYTPVPLDTMATFPTAATECTAYVSATRPVVTLNAPSNGQSANNPTALVFTGNTNGKVVIGGFISTSPTKGGTSGPLLSAARFFTPKALDSGGKLEVSVVFSAASI